MKVRSASEKFDILSCGPSTQAQISCRWRSLVTRRVPHEIAETAEAQESGNWSHHCGRLDEGEAQSVGWLGILLTVAEVPSSGFRLRC